MNEAEIKERLSKYKFYHVIRLTETLYTSGIQDFVPLQEPIYRFLKDANPNGKRFLDIGCRDGLFSFEAEKLGASEIIAIDNDLSPAAVEFLIPYFNSKVRMYELNLYDLTPEKFGLFDVVLFAGVLYHLRYPFWALKLIRNVLAEGGKLIIETGVMLDDNQRPLMLCPVGNESPYSEPTSCTFFNLKGLNDTLFSLGLVVERMELLNTRSQVEVLPSRPQVITIRIGEQLVEKRERPGPPQLKVSLLPNSSVNDRATLICRKSFAAIDGNVAQYWDGVHKVHDTGKIYPDN